MLNLEYKSLEWWYYMRNLGFYNGTVGLIEDISIPMLDRGMYFGDGVYEATFTINHNIFALNEHIDRLYRSAALVDIKIPYTKNELKVILKDLVRMVDDDKQFVYWQITRGTAPRKHNYSNELEGNLYITLTPYNDIGNFKKKLKVITIEDTRFLHCNIKTLNLMVNVMASQKAAEAGCDEAIFHRGNIVTEASHSNVHIIKGGKLKTHPTDNLILPGISRMHILEICKKCNIKVVEEPFTLDELMDADEILISSSSKVVIDVNEINGKHVGGKNYKIVKLIQDEYMKKIIEETK